MNHAKIQAFLASHTFVKILTAIGCLIILIVVFEAGVATGYHKASFAYHWEENYEHNFGRPESPFMMGARAMPNPHGGAGMIASVTLPTFVIVGGSEDEKVVRIASTTVIRNGAAAVDATQLSPGMTATVIGTPNDEGEIQAELIRIMPAASSTPRR